MPRITKASNQRDFDAIVTHLRTQGEQATDKKGDCQYRTADGLSCAIGCRIPDDVYHPGMEGRGVWRLIEYSPRVAELFAHTDPGMLYGLQGVHDRTYYWDGERGGNNLTVGATMALQSIAETYGLKKRAITAPLVAAP